MSRLTLPLKFGQHSEKDASWQAAALRSEHYFFSPGTSSYTFSRLLRFTQQRAHHFTLAIEVLKEVEKSFNSPYAFKPSAAAD